MAGRAPLVRFGLADPKVSKRGRRVEVVRLSADAEVRLPGSGAAQGRKLSVRLASSDRSDVVRSSDQADSAQIFPEWRELSASS